MFHLLLLAISGSLLAAGVAAHVSLAMLAADEAAHVSPAMRAAELSHQEAYNRALFSQHRRQERQHQQAYLNRLFAAEPRRLAAIIKSQSFRYAPVGSPLAALALAPTPLDFDFAGEYGRAGL